MSRSIALRVGSALTALLTVWCLGCSGFEPLVAAMSDHPAAPSVASAPLDGTSMMAQAECADSDCACGHTCIAEWPASPATPASRALAPTAASIDLAQPPSIARRPLIPPPERTLA